MTHFLGRLLSRKFFITVTAIQSFGFLALLNASGSVERQSSTCSQCFSCFWPAHIGFEGRGGNFRDGGGGDIWVPVLQNGCAVTFIQGGGGYFQSLRVANIGAGQRGILSPRLGGGVNVFGDVGITDSNKTFAQVGVGLELFGCSWLARANGYVPLTGTHGKDAGVEQFLVDTFAVTSFNSIKYKSYGGFDVEAGYEFNLGCGHLWGYGGYFYRDRKNDRSIQGPQVRVEYRLDCGCPFPRWEWIVSANYEYDRIHGHTVSGYGGVRYYIGRRLPPSCCDSPICRYMGRRVWRDPAIWVESEKFADTVVNQLIFVDESTDGIGSQTDPATLANGLAMLQPEGVLFFLQNTGDIIAPGTITPPVETQLLGFGDSDSRVVTFADGLSFNVIDLTGAGRAVVLGGIFSPIVEAVDDLFTSGWQIDDGGIGIRQGAGVGPVLVSDMILNDQTTNGIFHDGGDGLAIENTVITTPAISLRGLASAGQVLVSDSQFTSTAANAIQFDSPAVGGRLQVSDGSIIEASAGTGIETFEVRVLRVDTGSQITGASLAMEFVGSATAPGNDIRIFDSTLTQTAGGVGSEVITLLRVTAAGTSNVLVIERNTFVGGAATSALTYPGSALLSTVTFNERIFGNTFNVGNFGVEGSSTYLNDAVATLEVSNNVHNGTNDVIDLNLSRVTAAVPVNITADSNSGIGSSGYEFRGSVGATNVGCVTIQNNNNTPITGTDITLTSYNAAQSKSVFDFSGGIAGLSATNNGLGIAGGSAPAAAPVPCPLPVIPPAP